MELTYTLKVTTENESGNPKPERMAQLLHEAINADDEIGNVNVRSVVVTPDPSNDVPFRAGESAAQ